MDPYTDILINKIEYEIINRVVFFLWKQINVIIFEILECNLIIQIKVN